ncbi:MAG: LPS export ABC transporter periplasmic protein LptC [Candidatus Methylomirabilales bacterium]
MQVSFWVLVVTLPLVAVNLFGPRIPVAVAGEGASVTPVSSSPAPDAAMKRVRITETRKGKQLWDVEADAAEVFDDRGVAVLTRGVNPVRIVIYNGKETLISFADKAIVDLRTKDLKLIGHVRSESSRGTKIFAEALNWSAAKRQITTDVPVVVEKKGFQIRGKGMMADTILERMTIRKRIASQITLSGKREQGR